MKFFITLTILLIGFYTGITHATSCNSTQESPFCRKEIKTKGAYMGLIEGLNFFDVNHMNKAKFARGYYFGGMIGYKFASNIRMEAEVSYQRSEINSIKSHTYSHRLKDLSGHLWSWSYLANLLVDFDLNLPFLPYFGSGLGYLQAYGHCAGYSIRKKDSFFAQINTKQIFKIQGIAWQGIIGIKYLLHKGIEVSIDYRYFLAEQDVIIHKLGLALTKYF